MTYTTVYKDYRADTLEAAAGEMLRDDEVWKRPGLRLAGGDEAGEPMGYAVESWAWDEATHTLRVNFR